MSVQSTSLNAPEVQSILKYACVRFDDDTSNLYIKDIQCIIEKIPSPAGKISFKKFLPKHEDDFDKKKCYHVKWLCQKPCTIKSSHRCDPFLKANILYLGDSRDAVSKKIEAGRVKFPKMDWASESTYVTPERNTLSLQSNEQVILNANNKPGIFSNGIISDESQSDGENEDDDNTKNNSLSDNNKSTKEKIVEEYKLKKLLSTRSLLAEKKKDKSQVAIAANGDSNGDDDETLDSHEPSNLSDEEEEVNKENQGTKNENSTKAQSNKRKPKIQKRKPKKYKTAEKFELNIGHKRYEELDEDTIYLGLDVSVDKEVWREMNKRKPKNSTIFLRDLMELIWPENELKNKCLKLHLTSFRYPGEERMEFEPDRMQLLKAKVPIHLSRHYTVVVQRLFRKKN